MRKIRLKDAKAKLSMVVNDAVRGKPSVITRCGDRPPRELRCAIPGCEPPPSR
jgi:hypothetical protein